MARAGSGNDLLALRRYNPGDSHRLIHWKASARTQQLLVRQFAAESAEAFSAWLQTDGATWSSPEQFERFVSFAATLCEDLFRTGRLSSVIIDDREPLRLRGVRDLEVLLNSLAVLQPSAAADSPTSLRSRANLITFSPEGPKGVSAWVHGERIASV